MNMFKIILALIGKYLSEDCFFFFLNFFPLPHSRERQTLLSLVESAKSFLGILQSGSFSCKTPPTPNLFGLNKAREPIKSHPQEGGVRNAKMPTSPTNVGIATSCINALFAVSDS